MTNKRKSDIEGRRRNRKRMSLLNAKCAEIVVLDGLKHVSLSRRMSYRYEVPFKTVIQVAEFISENTHTNLDVITNSIRNVSPTLVGKSLITLEQRGLVKLNARSGSVVKAISSNKIK